MTRTVRQIPTASNQNSSYTEVLNERSRSSFQSIGNITTPQSGIDEQKSQENTFTCGEGEYGGYKNERPHSSFRTISDTRFTRLVTITNKVTTFNGVTFVDTDNETQTKNLVKLTATGVAVFLNCTFIRNYQADTSAVAADNYGHVLMETGSKAVFQNCTFRSTHATGVMNGSGFAINNLGAAGDCVANGNVNITTHIFSNTITAGNIT